MAIMIPPIPKISTVESREVFIFSALEKLPDTYYVFHSFQITTSGKGGTYESETDFVVFNVKKGILVIEAKAGKVRYENGQWLYSNRVPMKYDGPFNQASRNKYKIKNYIESKGNRFDLLQKCAFQHCVCFPSISNGVLNSITLPPEAAKPLIITKDDLDDIEKAIERIYGNIAEKYKQKELSKNAINYLINSVLCPTFDLIPSKSYKRDLAERKFNILLNEQKKLLNFLEEQKSALISGSAGTGKTMIALEKARRHSELKERVLFLCFNKKLQEHLEKEYGNKYIDFYTIDKFAVDYTGTVMGALNILRTRLEELYINEEDFKYDHIIIDEGQDFGKEEFEEQDIITLLANIMEQTSGSFYIFYDKNQLVQSDSVPNYIQEADCKMTLYQNCRNTYNVAMSSMTLLDKDPILRNGSIRGETPQMAIESKVENNIHNLRRMIDALIIEGYEDIVILTTTSLSKSSIFNYIVNEKLHHKNKEYIVSTVRRFKGLEANAIIMIDLDEDDLTNDDLLYYVGSSRAKLTLNVLVNITDDGIMKFLESKNVLKGRSIQKSFASYFNCILKKGEVFYKQ